LEPSVTPEYRRRSGIQLDDCAGSDRKESVVVKLSLIRKEEAGPGKFNELLCGSKAGRVDDGPGATPQQPPSPTWGMRGGKAPNLQWIRQRKERTRNGPDWCSVSGRMPNSVLADFGKRGDAVAIVDIGGEPGTVAITVLKRGRRASPQR
jgi:hypothetical protein